MKLTKFGLLLSLLLWAGAPSLVAQAPTDKMRANNVYKPGQEWSYRTRTGEANSFLIVLKVENDAKLGIIVHIALGGLKIKNARSSNGFTDKVNHLPFAKEAIDKSVLKLLKEDADLPDFEEGYRLWREAFDAKRAGIYATTIAEAINTMEAILNQ